MLTDRLPAPATGAWTIDVARLPGTRWTSLVAVDEAGLASLPMGADLPPVDGKPRRVHLLAIGVDQYADADIPDLQLAAGDARRFAGSVAAIGGDVAIASTTVLADAEASGEKVLEALRKLTASAGPGETVVLFFAGHGVRGDDGAYYLATPETRIADIPGSALPWTEVAAILAAHDGRVAVFLDTCHSGAAEAGVFAQNDDAAASLLERMKSGIVVFSASKGRELSEESDAAGGGVFTSALVAVITGDRAAHDANRNGAIEISELYRGVKGRVRDATGQRQNPWIVRNQMVGDFALF